MEAWQSTLEELTHFMKYHERFPNAWSPDSHEQRLAKWVTDRANPTPARQNASVTGLKGSATAGLM
jgi:hypothetical protein